jgi:hypothetical protein
MVGWMFFLTRLAATAAIANVFVDYLGAIAPVLGSGAGRFAAITTAVGGLAVLNVFGVRGASRAVNALTIAKLVPLALFVIVGRASSILPDRAAALISARCAGRVAGVAYAGSRIQRPHPGGGGRPAPPPAGRAAGTIGAARCSTADPVVAQGTLPGWRRRRRSPTPRELCWGPPLDAHRGGGLPTPGSISV